MVTSKQKGTSFSHLLMSAALFSTLTFSGQSLAEYNPVIHPGLWETRVSLKGDMIDAVSAQISSLPKEVQQKMRAKIADLQEEPGPFDKECITPRQAKKYFDDIMGDEDCKNELQWTGEGHGILTSTCTDGRIEHSDIRINGSKEISIASTVTETDGTSGTSIWHGRWLSDDCGSVEPEN